jgi:hypothetical protein
MMERENNLLVPAIAQIVPESEQKSFNNKVLKNLGLWDSRLHLVGMHEAVLECDDPQEHEIFKQAIPSIPQLMIPRWKRNLYDQKSSILDSYMYQSTALLEEPYLRKVRHCRQFIRCCLLCWFSLCFCFIELGLRAYIFHSLYA